VKDMVDLRKIVVIFVIAVLFSIFVFSSIDAVYEEPRYDDFCKEEKPLYYPKSIDSDEKCAGLSITDEDHEACLNEGGRINYKYDEYNCAVSYYCETCYSKYDDAREKHNMYKFFISAFFGLIAIIAALYLPNNNNINEWISTGFMLGGLFTLFFGTAIYFGDMAKFLRPIVMFIELMIVIYLAYKKLNTPDKKGTDKK
jgi:hypothetical protein